MPEPVLELSRTELTLAPNSTASVEIRVTNTGPTVVQMGFAVIGDVPRRLAAVEPPTLDLYPGSSGTATVTFTAPEERGAPSGVFAFGVMAYPVDSPRDSTVAEGRISIAAVRRLTSRIVPLHSTGRWSGRHRVQFSNLGNAPVFVQPVPFDPDTLLGFYVSPGRIALAPGESATARLAVRTRKPFLRGAPKTIPFRVIAETELDRSAGEPVAGDPARPVADGVFVQKPILSMAFVLVVVLLLAAVVGGGAYALTRPAATPKALDPLGAPPRPTGFSVRAVGPNDVRIQWDRVPQVAGYKLYDVDPVDRLTQVRVRTIDNGDQNGFNDAGLLPDTVYCYQLRAVRSPTLVSPLTDVACDRTRKLPTPPPVTTPPVSTPPVSTPPVSTPPVSTPPVSTPPPGGRPTSTTRVPPGTWVVLANYWPVDSTQLKDALTRAGQLSDRGLGGMVLRSTDYATITPRTQPLVGSYYLVVAAPFGSKSAAEGACAAVLSVKYTARPCIVRQLSAR